VRCIMHLKLSQGKLARIYIYADYEDENESFSPMIACVIVYARRFDNGCSAKVRWIVLFKNSPVAAGYSIGTSV